MQFLGKDLLSGTDSGSVFILPSSLEAAVVNLELCDYPDAFSAG
jgi:hypothetical protein